MVKDMRKEIYNNLIQNEVINEYVPTDNIRFHKWTNEERVSYPFILIVPLHSPVSGQHGSDTELSKTMTYDIHAQGDCYKTVKTIMNAIHQEMKSLGFGQLNGGLDDFLEETKKFVDVRRYRIFTDLYNVNY